jgi:hypothetical protein
MISVLYRVPTWSPARTTCSKRFLWTEPTVLTVVDIGEDQAGQHGGGGEASKVDGAKHRVHARQLVLVSYKNVYDFATNQRCLCGTSSNTLPPPAYCL